MKHTLSRKYIVSRCLKTLVALSCLLFQSAQAQTQAAQYLAELLQKTVTFKASVQQLVLDQEGREVQETQALLKLKKPDHFYWEITSPYAELMVTNGELIYRFEPDLEQVTIQPFENDLDRNPMLMLNGDARLLDTTYSISHNTLDYNNRDRFILIPKQSSSLYESLSLTFYQDFLEEMQFESSLGQSTSFYFSDLVMNHTISDADFEFEVPDNIEIIDMTEE